MLLVSNRVEQYSEHDIRDIDGDNQIGTTWIINTTKSNSVTVKNVILWVDFLNDDEGDDGVLKEVVEKFNEFQNSQEVLDSIISTTNLTVTCKTTREAVL